MYIYIYIDFTRRLRHNILYFRIFLWFGFIEVYTIVNHPDLFLRLVFARNTYLHVYLYTVIQLLYMCTNQEENKYFETKDVEDSVTCLDCS